LTTPVLAIIYVSAADFNSITPAASESKTKDRMQFFTNEKCLIPHWLPNTLKPFSFQTTSSIPAEHIMSSEEEL